MYSGSKNYLGWNNHVHNSLFVRPDESDFGRRWTHCNGNAGLNSTWINNTCITEIDVYQKAPYTPIAVDHTRGVASGNVCMAPNGSATVGCTAGETLAEYQKRTGRDVGSVTAPMPSTQEVLAMAKKVLGFGLESKQQ
jgi:hypothetical protein